MDRRTFLNIAGGSAALAVTTTKVAVEFGKSQPDKPVAPLYLSVPGQLSPKWHKCFEKLLTCKPANRIGLEKWQRIISGANRLAAGHIASLNEFGWTPMEIFAVNAIKPERRLDQAGVLYLLANNPITLISVDRIGLRTETGSAQTIYRKPAHSWERDGLAMLWEV